MRVSICRETLSTAEGGRSNASVVNLKAGGLLQARIVEITASGKTVFQFDGFRAVAGRRVEGQIGDIWQFEVLRDMNAQSDRSQQRHSAANPAQPVGRPRISNAVSQSSISLRLIPLSGKHDAFESSKNAPATSLRMTFSGVAIPVTPPGLSSQVLQPVQVLWTWLQQMRDAMPWSGEIGAKSTLKQWKLQTEAREKASPQLLDHPDPADLKKVDRSGEPWHHIMSGGFQLGQRRIKMNLYRRSSGREANAPPNLLKAVFLLDLENAGAMRVDIKMGAEHIQVGIFVKDEDTRSRFSAGLPALTNALSALSKQCYCHVAVDASKIQEGYEEQLVIPEAVRLNIQA